MEISELSTSSLVRLYKSLSYFDTYGTYVMAVGMISLITLLGVAYCTVMMYSEEIIDDWNVQRCKPSVIPFAGIINKPDGMTASEFTHQNFTFCTQRILTNTTGAALSPLTFITSTLSKMASSISAAVNSIRNMINKVRTNLQNVIQELMGRLLNMTIPLQQIIISLRDMLAKLQGTMTTALFTLMGSYMTMKTLLGAIAEFIVTILIVFAAIIAGLWAVPFTWGFAAANTAIFVAISIPMAIILSFMKNVMHVDTGLKIPKVSTCFSGNTEIYVSNPITGKYEMSTFENLTPGCKLLGGQCVTAVMKLQAPKQTDRWNRMFNLNGIIVSGSHTVKYNNTYILVNTHPNAIPINYTSPYIYCINTTDGLINLDGNVFTDWDCLSDDEIETLSKIENVQISQLVTTKHKLFDVHFSKNTQVCMGNGNIISISNVKIGDKVSSGGAVYGVVHMMNFAGDTTYHLLTQFEYFMIEKDKNERTFALVGDYNMSINDKLNFLQKNHL